nr:PAS domain S-box protein [Bacteroidota bacterium]
TERKRAEEELRESEERYRTLFESTIDGLFVLDAETKKVVFANQTGAKAYGFDSAEEVVGLNPLDFVHPEDKDKTAGIIEKDMFENNLQQIHEYRSITKDGREVWISAVGIRIEYQKRLAGLVTIRDITEHKKAEQINLRLAEIIRNASDGIILTNPEGQIHYINPAFEKMSGYTQDELLTTDPANLIVTDDITAIAKKIRSAVKTKGEWKGDLFCRRKNGEIYPIDTRVFAIKNIKGELVEIAAIQQDITERKQAEEALRESEEKYRAVLEQSADNIYLIDIETKKILESNSTLRNLLGYSAGEMKKLTVYDFVTHQKDDINEKIEKVINQGRVFIGERKYLRKDGSPVDVEVSSSFITFGNRKALCVVSRDITERKKAEVALHESEERYRAIVEQSNDAIYIYRGDKFLFVNDRVYEITGYSKEVLYELNMWSLLHPDDRERIMEIGRNRAKGEKVPSIYEAHIVNINGDIRQCEFRVRTISYNGEYAVLGAVRDVTESRKAQDELKKYAETQKALLKEVNHRVKNNLTAILGLLGMEEARTENKDYTDFINKFKGRISGLSAIHSLLSESGWLSLNLGHLCEQVIKASVSCIPDSNLINFNVSPSAILINSNQAHHLTLVINELITNSIKHGQNYKNEIHLDIDLKKDKENVIITYKDTGKGYPQELIDEYFSNIGVGFELIKGIVTHSLRGELQIYNDNGAVTIIIFKPDKETYI